MTDTFRIAVRRFGPFESAIDTIWRDFEAAHHTGLKLEAVALDLNDLEATLLHGHDLHDGAWDVAFVSTDWIAELVERAAVRDLAPLMARAPLADYPAGWVDSLLAAQRWDERIYALPFHDGPECCIYRRDLFEDQAEQRAFRARHGYDLAPPRTWHEYADIARFFTRPEQGLYGTVFAAFPDGHNTVYDFCLQLWSRGGALTDHAGAVTLDTPAAVAALDWYRTVVRDSGATVPDAARLDSVAAGEVFARGDVALMINWFGFATVCQQPDCAVRGRIGIDRIPSDDGERDVSLSVYWMLAIAAGSRHSAVAWDFLRHAVSPAMDKQTTLGGAVGCRRSTWQDAEVNAAIPFYHRLADLAPGARTLPRSRAFPALARIIDALVQEAITSDTPSAVILGRAQHAARDLVVAPDRTGS